MKLNRMQDVHEFLVLFCESLESQYVKLGHKINPFSENFHFQLEEQKVCCECQHLTEKIKEDFVLRLDMPSSPTKTGVDISFPNLKKKLKTKDNNSSKRFQVSINFDDYLHN